ncbi:MAG: cobalamin biosynthesis protein CobW [Alphaproteobacteria bacterium]|nr:cobalamin biosynthesis protein CobW [Alphaproteobacteria bacterium]
MTTKIPATVITGFLGAGKTTMIRNLLLNAGGRRIALIINEYGDVGVDGEILKGCGQQACKEEDIVELANGCICCTVADDFVPTMNKILNRADQLDHIIIETSGLALPQPLVRAFNWPDIKSRVTVDGVITMVDAKALNEGRFADNEEAIAAQRAADPNVEHENPIQELFNDQINSADIVLLNKADLLSADQLLAVSNQLKQKLRPGSRLVHTSQGVISADVLLGQKAGAEEDMHNRLSTHEKEGEVQHDHDDFISFIVELPSEQTKDSLLACITKTITTYDILRMKGFASVVGSDARLLVQAVGPRLNSYFDRAWGTDETRRTQLVVIGEKAMDVGAIEASLRG